MHKLLTADTSAPHRKPISQQQPHQEQQRALNTCHTRNVSRVYVGHGSGARALDWILGLQFLRVVKVNPSHQCFTAPCLTHKCLRTSLHRFLHLHLIRLPLLRRSVRRRVHPLPLCKEGYVLAEWLNNPLSQVMSPSLSSKSAVSTRRLTYLRERRCRHGPRRSRGHCGCV